MVWGGHFLFGCFFEPTGGTKREGTRCISPLRAKRESDSARALEARYLRTSRAPTYQRAGSCGDTLDKAAAIADNKPLKCQEAQRPPLIAPRSPAPLSAALQRSFLSSFSHSGASGGTDPPAEKAIVPEHVLCHLLNGVDQHLSNSPAVLCLLGEQGVSLPVRPGAARLPTSCSSPAAHLQAQRPGAGQTSHSGPQGPGAQPSLSKLDTSPGRLLRRVDVRCWGDARG